MTATAHPDEPVAPQDSGEMIPQTPTVQATHQAALVERLLVWETTILPRTLMVQATTTPAQTHTAREIPLAAPEEPPVLVTMIPPQTLMDQATKIPHQTRMAPQEIPVQTATDPRTLALDMETLIAPTHMALQDVTIILPRRMTLQLANC